MGRVIDPRSPGCWVLTHRTEGIGSSGHLLRSTAKRDSEMNTYTMNGHRHSTAQIQPEILKGIVGNQFARFTKSRWRLRAQPEKFSCLQSSDPELQIQAALKQIEALLQENRQLLETLFALSQSVNSAHSFAHKTKSIDWPVGSQLQLSGDSDR